MASLFVTVPAIFCIILLIHASWLRRTMLECRNFPIDFSNIEKKVIIITGANSGLGFESALQLAREKATVVLACRSVERCNDAKKQILTEYPYANVDDFQLDLTDLQSVRNFADNFAAKYDHVDVLFNNAGMPGPKTPTYITMNGERTELALAANHYGHFLLTSLLYPKIARNGRIIVHSSPASLWAREKFPIEDMFLETERFSGLTVYSNSKQANLLFAYELNHRLKQASNPKNIKVIAVHPGFTATNIQTDQFPFWNVVNDVLAMNVKDGVKAPLFAIADPNAQSSDKDYFGPKYIGFGAPAVTTTHESSWNKERQKFLWEDSLRRTNAKFNI